MSGKKAGPGRPKAAPVVTTEMQVATARTRTNSATRDAPMLFEVDDPASGPAVAADPSPPTQLDSELPPLFPPGVKVADVRREMVEAGAPQDFLDTFDTFGDNLDTLTAWLREVGFGASPDQTLLRLLEGWRPLLKRGATALDAELCGVEFLAMFEAAIDEAAVDEAAVDEAAIVEAVSVLIAGVSATGSGEALAMCRVFAHLGPAEVRADAGAAAHRLALAGAKDMPWAHNLGKAEFEDAYGYADPDGEQETLAVQFAYGREPHTCIVLVDHGLGGGVKDLWLTDESSETRVEFRLAANEHGFRLNPYTAEQAATILNDALAAPPCPVDPEQIEDVTTYLPLLRVRIQSLPAPATVRPNESAAPPQGLGTPNKTVDQPPAKMKRSGKSRNSTKIHRIKVTLAGTKPPIWRRLEVPSDTSLADLHELLQVAFAWDGGHLWAFETQQGEFGESRGLGHGDSRRATLGAVAPRQGSKFRYVYDFGDNWEHAIVVEAIVAAEEGVAYPQCTAGRLAAPPEDCGGVWGYSDMLDILGDPENPEHDERLEWLGLESAAEFDPERFSPVEVNEILHD